MEPRKPEHKPSPKAATQETQNLNRKPESQIDLYAKPKPLLQSQLVSITEN